MSSNRLFSVLFLAFLVKAQPQTAGHSSATPAADPTVTTDKPCAVSEPPHPESPMKRAYLDNNNCVHIVYSDDRDIQVPREQEQVSVESLQVSPDNKTAGWLVETPNCCTSYPIATLLVLYRHGEVVQRIGDGLMLYQWKFVDRGARIAVSSGTVHGMNGVHLTLYDANNGKRLRKWDGEPGVVPPAWGASLSP